MNFHRPLQILSLKAKVLFHRGPMPWRQDQAQLRPSPKSLPSVVALTGDEIFFDREVEPQELNGLINIYLFLELRGKWKEYCLGPKHLEADKPFKSLKFKVDEGDGFGLKRDLLLAKC